MTVISRERHGQQIFDKTGVDGDCFRACMSVLLDVPNGEHLPHGIVENTWWSDWHYFLWDLGLAVMAGNPEGPIWKSHPWIATVPSKNIVGTHAIVMDHAKVLFDPSTHRRYRAGTYLSGKNVVLGGTWIEVSDASKLERFVKWRRKVNRSH